MQGPGCNRAKLQGPDSGISPHSPVRLFIQPNCRFHRHKELVRPPLIPSPHMERLQKGPMPPPSVELAQARPLGATREDIDSATHLFEMEARAQLMSRMPPQYLEMSATKRAQTEPYLK